MHIQHCLSPRHRGQAPDIQPGDVVQASPLVPCTYAGVAPALVVSGSTTGDATGATRRYLLWWWTMGAPALVTSVQTVPECELRRIGGPEALGGRARAYLARLADEGAQDQRAAVRAALA